MANMRIGKRQSIPQPVVSKLIPGDNVSWSDFQSQCLVEFSKLVPGLLNFRFDCVWISELEVAKVLGSIYGFLKYGYLWSEGQRIPPAKEGILANIRGKKYGITNQGHRWKLYIKCDASRKQGSSTCQTTGLCAFNDVSIMPNLAGSFHLLPNIHLGPFPKGR
jgi:hypothetical protein